MYRILILPLILEDDSPAPPPAIFLRPATEIAAPYSVVTPPADFTQVRQDLVTFVAVVALLSGSPVYYVWYVDGAWVATTQSPSFMVFLDTDQVSVDCIQTLDPDFDVLANAPVAYSARRTLSFVRSLDPAIYQYRIEQQIGMADPTVLTFIFDHPGTWQYTYLTPRLTDLASYVWNVIPMDAAGNDGPIVSLGGELIVRTPDAPKFSATFDAAHDQVICGGIGTDMDVNSRCAGLRLQTLTPTDVVSMRFNPGSLPGAIVTAVAARNGPGIGQLSLSSAGLAWQAPGGSPGPACPVPLDGSYLLEDGTDPSKWVKVQAYVAYLPAAGATAIAIADQYGNSSLATDLTAAQAISGQSTSNQFQLTNETANAIYGVNVRANPAGNIRLKTSLFSPLGYAISYASIAPGANVTFIAVRAIAAHAPSSPSLLSEIQWDWTGF